MCLHSCELSQWNSVVVTHFSVISHQLNNLLTLFLNIIAFRMSHTASQSPCQLAVYRQKGQGKLSIGHTLRVERFRVRQVKKCER